MISPTVRQLIRNRSTTADFDVWVVSHAAVSSKDRVWPAPCRAQGTAATLPTADPRSLRLDFPQSGDRCSYGLFSQRCNGCVTSGHEGVVDLPGDEPLQAADDLSLGQPLRRATLHVALGALIP